MHSTSRCSLENGYFQSNSWFCTWNSEQNWEALEGAIGNKSFWLPTMIWFSCAVLWILTLTICWCLLYFSGFCYFRHFELFVFCFLISEEWQESWCIHNVFASTEHQQRAATKRPCMQSKASFTELLHIHACAKRHFHNKRVSLRALCVVLLRAVWHSVCHLVSLRRRRGTHTMAARHRGGVWKQKEL